MSASGVETGLLNSHTKATPKLATFREENEKTDNISYRERTPSPGLENNNMIVHLPEERIIEDINENHNKNHDRNLLDDEHRTSTPKLETDTYRAFAPVEEEPKVNQESLRAVLERMEQRHQEFLLSQNQQRNMMTLDNTGSFRNCSFFI